MKRWMSALICLGAMALMAQLALALNGQDRAQVLSQMLELLADRELRTSAGGTRQ